MLHGWNYLASGSYNDVYLNQEKTLVFKIQQSREDRADNPERSVRLWNLFNSHITPPAQRITIEDKSGWICPYIEGSFNVSDTEISDIVLDIFNRTGRILVDAVAKHNFIKTNPPNSQVVCIDFGLALALECQEDNASREKSITSLETWENIKTELSSFFKQSTLTQPLSTALIKALLFIKLNRPDMHNADFLRNNKTLIKKLATAYDIYQNEMNYLNANLLKQIDDCFLNKEVVRSQPSLEVNTIMATPEIILSPESQRLPLIKAYCEMELNNYLISREQSMTSLALIPLINNSFFRNQELTARKVNAVNNAIANLKKAKSIQALSQVIKTLDTPDLLSSSYTYGLEQAIKKCQSVLTERISDQEENPTTVCICYTQDT